MKNTTTKTTKKTVETVDNLKNDSIIGRDNNKAIATVSSKDKTMKQTTKKMTVQERAEKKLESYNNNSFQVVDGSGLSKKNKESLEKYLRDNWKAAIVTNTVNTLQIGYVKLCKEFSKWSGCKVSAQSLDLHKIIVDILYKIAKEIKDSLNADDDNYNSNRIPVLKSHQEQGSKLCSMSIAYFDDYYEQSEKKAERKAEKEKQKAEQSEQTEQTEQTIEQSEQTAEQVTEYIISLLGKYNNSLDLVAIQRTIDSLLPSANIEVQIA